MSIYIEVSCSQCLKIWQKAKHGLYGWSGLCQSCAAKNRDRLLQYTLVSCKKCGNKKQLPKNVAPLYGGYCRNCAPYETVYVSCKQCKKSWEKRKSNLSVWNGYCLSCSSKDRFLDSEYLENARENSRRQVLSMGGIPNAKHFTSDDVRGPANNNWKGGITPAVMKIRNSIAYKNWRTEIFEKNDYTCQHCKCRGGYLHAHHIKSFSKFPDQRLDICNGIALCIPCHRKEHKRLAKHQK